MIDKDFELKFKDGYRLTNLQVIYYLPDFSNLVQEFFWQTLDIQPKYPRVHKFLNFWKSNIDAVIKEVYISTLSETVKPSTYRNATIELFWKN